MQTRRSEGASGGEELVSVVVVRSTMKLIRSRLDREIQRPARVASHLSGSEALQRELINRIKRQHDTRDSPDADLIYGHHIAPGIVVVCAFNLPVDAR